MPAAVTSTLPRPGRASARNRGHAHHSSAAAERGRRGLPAGGRPQGRRDQGRARTLAAQPSSAPTSSRISRSLASRGSFGPTIWATQSAASAVISGIRPDQAFDVSPVLAPIEEHLEDHQIGRGQHLDLGAEEHGRLGALDDQPVIHRACRQEQIDRGVQVRGAPPEPDLTGRNATPRPLRDGSAPGGGGPRALAPGRSGRRSGSDRCRPSRAVGTRRSPAPGRHRRRGRGRLWSGCCAPLSAAPAHRSRSQPWRAA